MSEHRSRRAAAEALWLPAEEDVPFQQSRVFLEEREEPHRLKIEQVRVIRFHRPLEALSSRRTSARSNGSARRGAAFLTASLASGGIVALAAAPANGIGSTWTLSVSDADWSSLTPVSFST